MGERAQVKMVSKDEECPIYLYSHYDGSNLINVVKSAILKQWRWDDFSYLTRIIFCEMVKDDINGEVGYGIDTSEHGDIEYLVTVDVDKQIIINTDVYDKYTEVMTFQDIVKEYITPKKGDVLSQKQKDVVKDMSDFKYKQERKRYGLN